MTERHEEKSRDYGYSIGEVERLSWNSLMGVLQVHELLEHKSGIQFYWDN